VTAPDFDSLRPRHFPGVADPVYLVTHSFGPCPAAMFDDLQCYLQSLRERPYGLAAWIERVEQMRGKIESLLDAAPGSVALRDCATACHAATLGALPPATGGRNRIVVSALHFPSISYLAHAQTRRGFTVEVIEPAQPGHLRADDLLEHVDDTVAAVCAPIVAPFNGALLDFDRLAQGTAEAGAIALLDGYSAIGVVPVAASRLAPCVLIGGTVKWLCGGGTGLSFMSVHPELMSRLEPADPGWMADADFLAFRPRHVPAPDARRFQQGTPALEPIYSARAGIDFVLEQGTQALRHRNVQQLQAMMARAREHGLTIRSPSDPELLAGLLAIEVGDPPAAVAALRERGIAIDTRGATTVRLGPHACVSIADCERAVDVLAEAEAHLRDHS
jgi:kynureninase